MGRNDQRPIFAKLEYVGWVEETFELNYRVLNTIVLLYNWVKANYNGSNATIKQDEYGFVLVKFSYFIPISDQSFVFPLHVEQVFFPNDARKRGWKVVLWKEPRGR